MTKHKETAFVTLLGGPADGIQMGIDTHETLTVGYNGATYERTDQQIGDYRVYRYAPAEGSAPGVELRESAVKTNLLERDLDELAAAEKKAARKH